MSSLGFPAQEPGRGARSVAGRAEEDVGATEPALTGPSDNEAALWDAVGVALAAVRLFVAWHVGVVSAERAMGLLGESVTTRGAGTSFGRTEETAAAKPVGGAGHLAAQKPQGEASCHGYCPRARIGRRR